MMEAGFSVFPDPRKSENCDSRTGEPMFATTVMSKSETRRAQDRYAASPVNEQTGFLGHDGLLSRVGIWH